MSAALLDSSIYISGMRRGEEAVLALRRSSSASALWLSAVALEDYMLAHLAGFGTLWNEWSGNSTACSGYRFRTSPTGLRRDKCWRV